VTCVPRAGDQDTDTCRGTACEPQEEYLGLELAAFRTVKEQMSGLNQADRRRHRLTPAVALPGPWVTLYQDLEVFLPGLAAQNTERVLPVPVQPSRPSPAWLPWVGGGGLHFPPSLGSWPQGREENFAVTVVHTGVGRCLQLLDLCK
jgi:hypothetical protein